MEIEQHPMVDKGKQFNVIVKEHNYIISYAKGSVNNKWMFWTNLTPHMFVFTKHQINGILKELKNKYECEEIIS